MISRAARKLENVLVPCSRQSLPRPPRLYSTATKRNNAPALATQGTPLSADYAAFMPSHENSPNDVLLFPGDMQNFLRRRTPYTLLPTPLPNDRTSPLNDLYFADSHTQDLFAVIGACLHNLYDVPRAKQIFERLRAKKTGDPLLVPQLYNSFLETYVNMAMTKGSDKRPMWIQDACRLFESMEEGTEKVEPTAGTYAVMLLTWSR
jgi:DNA-directed RNA polymerase